MGVGEVGSELGEVIPLGTEVVVDDVEDDTEAPGVRSVDETHESFGAAVGAVDGEEPHPVVPPAAESGEVGHRHDFDGVDAEVDEMAQALDGGIEGALGRERPDVHLVEHRAAQVASLPDLLPLEQLRIHHHAGAVRTLGLEPGAGVRQGVAAVEGELVQRARHHELGQHPPAGPGVIGGHGEVGQVNDGRHALGVWCPDGRLQGIVVVHGWCSWKGCRVSGISRWARGVPPAVREGCRPAASGHRSPRARTGGSGTGPRGGRGCVRPSRPAR